MNSRYFALSNTDIVIVGFQQASYTLSEDAGNVTVVALISTIVAHSFTVQVTGGKYGAWIYGRCMILSL